MPAPIPALAGLGAEAEEAERGRLQDRVGDAERRLDD